MALSLLGLVALVIILLAVYTPLLSEKETKTAIVLAAVIGFLAAAFFPAGTQSKVGAKLLGAELGVIASGRAYTFLAVLIVICILWAILRMVKPADKAASP